MEFDLSIRSLGLLEGMEPGLVTVVKLAASICNVKFRVEKATLGYINEVLLLSSVDKASEYPLFYVPIANAMKKAGKQHNMGVHWGGAWHIPDITTQVWSSEDMLWDYLDYSKTDPEGARVLVPSYFQINHKKASI